MRRMLIIGNQFTGLKSVEWPNWQSANILDYQALLFDCQGTSFAADNPALRIILSEFVRHGHPIYIILPKVAQQLELRFLPEVLVKVHAQRGDTIQRRDDRPLFSKYMEVLNGHDVYFQASMLKSGIWAPLNIQSVVNNVNRPVCGAVNNIFLLHPPARGQTRKALQIIIDDFRPEFEEPQPDPAPSWADEVVTKVPGVEQAKNQLSETDQGILELETYRQSQEKELQTLSEWAHLLWLTGVPLQRLIQKAFAFLGLQIEPRPETGHSEDFMAKHGDFVFLVEATGSTGSITIDKGRQLMHWVADSEIGNCHGVLVANAFSTEPPGNRPPTANHHIFSADLERYAVKHGLSLLDTRELFRIVCAKLGGKPIDLDAISVELCGKGAVRFSVS